MQIDYVSKVFLHVQSNYGQLFLKHAFSFIIYSPFLFKIGKDINIDDF